MENQNLPQCHYCDFKSADREEQRRHLLRDHHTKMIEIAGKGNKSIEWAIGMTASYFTYDNPQTAGNKKPRDG